MKQIACGCTTQDAFGCLKAIDLDVTAVQDARAIAANVRTVR